MNDYDDMPNGAFTDLELEAGVDSVYASDVRRRRWAPAKVEVESTISRDDLIVLLIKGICEHPLRADAETNPPSDGSVYLSFFSGQPDAPIPEVYLSLELDYDVPFSFLVDVLREAKLPLLAEDETLIWDDEEQRTDSFPAHFDREWQYEAARKKDHLERIDEILVQLIRRSALSTDHGKKPALIHRKYVAEALQGMEFPFERPRIIYKHEFDYYLIAFYDSLGKPRVIPLLQLAELDMPIYTRTSAFMVGRDGLYPFMNKAKLLISAFRIAVKHNPNQFEWYEARHAGTVFDSVFDRVEAPRDPAAQPLNPNDLTSCADPHRLEFEARQDCDAANNAMTLIELSSKSDRTTYITVGGHPFDAELVTTPQLYHHAVATLYLSGYHMQYPHRSGVKLTRFQTPLYEPPRIL